MSRTIKILITLIFILGAAAIAATTAIFSLQSKITSRLEKGWVLPPLEVYSQGFALSAGRRMPRLSLQQEFTKRGLSEGRDYEVLLAEACGDIINAELPETTTQCLWVKGESLLVAWDENYFIQEMWRGEPWERISFYSLFPQLITQFHNGQPIMQTNTPLSEMPLYCLQAATAIEDRDFLEHKGVSATGIMRAMLRNLQAGRFKEGGSTITQQLVKNFFLNSRKTIRRKIQEQILAIMLESQLSKDQILEMYLNVIYMGQSGPYQVLGFGSAAQYYFDKPIGRLNMAECALLGAVINSPGRYSPFEKPANARSRRELVLTKMHEAGMISAEEKAEAAAYHLPRSPIERRRSHAPYFVMSALKEFENLDLPADEGARIYTSLDPEAQLIMLSSIGKMIPAIEARVKKPSKQPLQVAALTVDMHNAQVIALTGGRDYRKTQFNRAYDSRRQIGSVIKPFVYLAAFPETDPLTSVLDEPFEWKVGRATWRPRNYDGKSFGPVPYFFALSHSLNIPAAKVGQEVGLDRIAEMIESSGITTKVPLLPSLTLGAFELSPWEVAQGFSTLGRMGRGDRIHTILRVEDIQGGKLYEREDATDIQLEPVATAMTVGMMKQVFEIGTARSAKAFGLIDVYAGKTGSTSDTKDAWFAGFNSRWLTVVWVGFDDNTAMGLTGSSAALPIWAEIMRAYKPLVATPDFLWPDGTEVREVRASELREKFPGLPENLPESLKLVFPNWAY